MQAIAAKIDRAKIYSIDEAVNLLNEVAKTKFKESIDVAVNLGVDPRKSDQAVRGATTLPHGTGKSHTRRRLRAGRECRQSESRGRGHRRIRRPRRRRSKAAK